MVLLQGGSKIFANHVLLSLFNSPLARVSYPQA